MVGLVQLKCGSVRTQSTGFYRGRTCIPRYVLASVGFLSWEVELVGARVTSTPMYVWRSPTSSIPNFNINC